MPPLQNTSSFDVDIHYNFLSEINALLQDISNLTDIEIIMNMRKAAATLGIGHTRVWHRHWAIPMRLSLLYKDNYTNEKSFVITEVRLGYENLLGFKVLYINDTRVQDIFEDMKDYLFVYKSNTTAKYAMAGSKMLVREFLYYFGAGNENDARALLAGIDRYGNPIEIYLYFEYVEEINVNNEAETINIVDIANYTMLKNTRQDEPLWFEYFANYNVFYVRHSQLDTPANDFAASDFTVLVRNLRSAITDVGSTRAFVYDLRGNPGGFSAFAVENFIMWVSVPQNRELLGEIYVIIDSDTFSGGILLAVSWKNFVPGVTTIGSPAGGNTNVIGAMFMEETPNFGIVPRVPGMVYYTNPSIRFDQPLIPDIQINHATLHNILNGHDPVLYYIKNR